jgi:predicted RNA methylase
MKLIELQSHLQDIENFQKPRQRLEQYITPPHLAAGVIHQVCGALLCGQSPVMEQTGREV